MVRYYIRTDLTHFLQARPWLYAVEGFDGVIYIVEGDYVAIIRRRDAILLHESEVPDIASKMRTPWREELLDIMKDAEDLREKGVML